MWELVQSLGWRRVVRCSSFWRALKEPELGEVKISTSKMSESKMTCGALRRVRMEEEPCLKLGWDGLGTI